MSGVIEETGALTAKGQTTVPKSVCQTLGLASGDRVQWRIVDGTVTVSRAAADEGDPAIASFLDLLERAIAAGRLLRDLPEDLAETLQKLAESDPDTEAPIEGETVL